MREIFAFIALYVMGIAFSIISSAQSIDEITAYVSGNYIEKRIDIPIVRDINGGTVFKINYEGEWDNEMKGAFEYACKIWEEQLPTCLPLNITACIGLIRGESGNGKPISKVASTGYYFTQDGFNSNVCTLSTRMKNILLKEFCQSGGFYQFGYDFSNRQKVDTVDIKITYNSDMLNECSFSLYSTPVDKYDFVSLAIRDIARGLGFSCRFTKNRSADKLDKMNSRLTAFENILVNALGTVDPSEAYSKAVDGDLNINIEEYGTLKIYTPNPWVNGMSLNYFEPSSISSANSIANVLSYEFGKGSVVRDITDPHYDALFTYGLGWKALMTTGYGSNGVSTYGNTDSIIPYRGNIYVPTKHKQRSNVNTYMNITLFNSNDILKSYSDDDEEEYFDKRAYMTPFHHFYRPGRAVTDIGWSVSILKKDGTWDVIYEGGYYDSPLEMSMEDAVFHYNDSVYSRTCDGYLRCRITRSTPGSSRGSNDYYLTFLALDYVPQKPHMSFDGVVETPQARTMAVAQADYDEYLRDVKIGIKNLEGTDRIIVEQLIEGDRIPTKFEVEDFKKGYFIATVDKEFYSWFTIVAENKNGSVRSETLEIAPLEPAEEYSFDVKISDETITIAGNSRRLYERNGLMRYEIAPLSGMVATTSLAGEIEENRAEIDIADLPGGVYLLNYYDRRGTRYSQKFVKRAR